MASSGLQESRMAPPFIGATLGFFTLMHNLAMIGAFVCHA
jgi:hypothetical protein